MSGKTKCLKKKQPMFCWAQQSGIHTVTNTSLHLHTIKRILECTWWEPQIIIPLCNTSAMSARPELKNAYFNSKTLSQIYFVVLNILSHLGPWNCSAKEEEDRSFVSLLNNLQIFLEETATREANCKDANLINTKAVLGRPVHCHNIDSLQKSVNRQDLQQANHIKGKNYSQSLRKVQANSLANSTVPST